MLEKLEWKPRPTSMYWCDLFQFRGCGWWFGVRGPWVENGWRAHQRRKWWLTGRRLHGKLRQSLSSFLLLSCPIPLTIFVPAPTVFLIADDSPSSEAMASFRKLLQVGVSEGFLQPQFAVKAHRDLGSTQCPGDNLYAELLKLKLSPKWERGFDSDWYGEETMQLWMQSVYADFIWEKKNISHCL